MHLKHFVYSESLKLLKWRSGVLIPNNKLGVFIAIFLAMVYLLVVTIQSASAQSIIRCGRENLVHGGIITEVFEQNVGVEEYDSDFAYNRFSQGGVFQVSGIPDSPIRIMPLGDSITKGTGICSEPDTYLICNGYRQDLWNALVDSGYSVDFVGSQGSAFQY